MTQRGYSASDLMKFLDFVGQKNLLKRNTVVGWRTASQKVFDALDAADKEDLREMDVEQALVRFENKAAGAYKPDSLRVYRSRFSAALEHFLKWNADPSTFKMAIRSRAGKPKSTATVIAKSIPKAKQTSITSVHDTLRDTDTARNDGAQALESLVLPIPLRPGMQVKIFGLPSDLSKSEARKISAVINAYATSDEGVD